VAAAPQYAHGVIDPIAEVAALAQQHGLPMHVDACVGGFVLPWLEKLGKRIPPWDFRVPGVTSISADIHKYGYAGKGASLLMWRSMADMRHQIFVATEFPGGIYVSPTMIGTRPGGPIASAWAALVGEGEVGYLELTRKAWDAAELFRQGIADIPGLRLLGDGDATIVAWTHAPGGPEVYGVAERMEARGWTIDRCQKPPCVHLTVTANHLAIVDDYLADLRASAAEVVADPSLARAGTAATYGMMAKVPIRGMVGASVRKFFEQMYSPGVIVPDLSAAQGSGLVDKLVARYGAQITVVLDKVEDVKERVAKMFR
jgi:glutamate/tyrosine decarboxylase-like PLP-dependent enzyme